MMRYLFPLLSILLNISVFAEITNKNILGEWIAYSENHMAIGGDINVKPTSIEYKKHGEVNFKILEASESEYILQLDKDVDDGIFMRIGPIRKSWSDDYLDLEVAYYETADKALKKRTSSMSNASSWGIYTKTK
jgi:hypothetical protein